MGWIGLLTIKPRGAVILSAGDGSALWKLLTLEIGLGSTWTTRTVAAVAAAAPVFNYPYKLSLFCQYKIPCVVLM